MRAVQFSFIKDNLCVDRLDQQAPPSALSLIIDWRSDLQCVIKYCVTGCNCG